MPSDDNPRWLTIKEAFERAVTNSILDHFTAIDLLGAGLSTGKLRGRAVELEPIMSADLFEPHSATPATKQSFSEIPPSLLENGRFGSGIFEEMEWSSPVAFQTDGGAYALHQLQVNRRDFDKLMRDSLSWDISGVMVGRSKNEHAWLQFIVSLVEIERDRRLTQKDFPSSADLLRELMEEIEFSGEPEKQLDERTFRPYVEGLWEILVRDPRSPTG
jgi:hypothetical protein